MRPPPSRGGHPAFAGAGTRLRGGPSSAGPLTNQLVASFSGSSHESLGAELAPQVLSRMSVAELARGPLTTPWWRSLPRGSFRISWWRSLPRRSSHESVGGGGRPPFSGGQAINQQVVTALHIQLIMPPCYHGDVLLAVYLIAHRCRHGRCGQLG